VFATKLGKKIYGFEEKPEEFTLECRIKTFGNT